MSQDDAAFSFKKIALPAFGPSLLFGLGEGAILPVIALSARDLGASVAVAALVVTLIGIGSLLSNIPASIITDKYGERWAIVGAAGLSVIAMLLCLSAPNLVVYGLGILLIGAASAVFNLARQKYLTEAVPVRFRARALSTLGADADPIGAVVLAGLIALSMPDLVHPGGADGSAPSPKVASIITSYRKIFLTVGIGVLLVSAVRSSRQVVIPLWAEGMGLDATTTSLIYGLSDAVDMLVFYPAGKLMDRKGRAWVAVPSMLIMAGSLLAMPFTGGAASLLLVSLLIGFGNGIGAGMVMTLGADYSPDSGRAQFLGIWRFLSDLGSFSGPALLSAITALATLGLGIAATGVLGLAAAAVLWYWIPRSANPEPA
ncbi:MAG: MFS transporter [Renibacterium salmoninarum]|nr:MFS transporter [Renibacterium salmoninarum]